MSYSTQPQTASERQATHFDDFCMQVDKLIGEFQEISMRMHQASVRAIGPEPEAVAASPKTPEPSSKVSLLGYKLGQLGDIASYQRTAMSKIERIV